MSHSLYLELGRLIATPKPPRASWFVHVEVAGDADPVTYHGQIVVNDGASYERDICAHSHADRREAQDCAAAILAARNAAAAAAEAAAKLVEDLEKLEKKPTTDAGRSVFWQRRNHNITQVGCDRCNRTVSHFRVRLAEYGAAVWMCVDCAEAAGVDIYQPAYPICQVPS